MTLCVYLNNSAVEFLWPPATNFVALSGACADIDNLRLCVVQHLSDHYTVSILVEPKHPNLSFDCLELISRSNLNV